MALSPQDKLYWQQRLGWKTFFYLWLATIFLGTVAFPLFLYSRGELAGSTSADFQSLILSGFFLGSLVTMLIYGIGRFYLHMGWLPPRR